MKTLINSNKKEFLLCLLVLLNLSIVYSQGRNSIYFLGYNARARMTFTDTSYSILPESRTISFNDTQGNISDENGNILMSSNGVFIADATGDTMMDGGGLNPGWGVNNCPDGLCMSFANLFLPIPGDSNEYILFHQVADIAAPVGLDALEIYYSIIDISQNGGLGKVVSKNNIALSGVFSWGYAACKHANGRDWWITAMNDVANGLHTFLLTPDTLEYMGLQTFPIQNYPYGFAGQPLFSPDGTKFAFGGSYGINGMNYLSSVTLLNFNRCDGVFNLDTVIDYSDNYISGSTAFSSNSKYLYFASVQKLYQFDTDTNNPYQLVAVNDTFLSAPPVFYTDFFQLYLAANGKIYISSGSSVKHLHEINNPDSAGTACDVQLHNVFTNCFFIGVPNHPNYYLGRLVGSPCDSLTSINDPPEHDFRFKVFPNPTMDGNFNILYLLPQNQPGKLEVFDINGRRIYEMNLPHWSTMQEVNLPKSISSGVYNCVITSGGERGSKKVVVYKE
ncbi:MAG: T9SS type A sorting domain-containing protein [Bacteroidia bacterium]|nr:T9SS type A sorting domain-containing protein [Bacteroidia bacterium]